MFRRLPLLLAALFGLAGSGAAETLIAPTLGAATNLSQGVQPGLVDLTRAVGLTQLRDGMNWGRVETAKGRYSFATPRTRFPDVIAQAGSTVTIVTNWGNPLYDGGDTPHSAEALEALTGYTAALVDRFPAIDGIEVGNEFNGVNFVRGPLKDMTPLQRARAYVPMLRAGFNGVKEAKPDLRVLGGATHSLPGGYLWEIMDHGGADYMDALAVHPYTTPAEQFVRQMEVLRRHPALAGLPVEITEFGTPGAMRAPGHMLRNYCQFGLGDVARAVWFPGNLRGEKMAPLFTPAGQITPAGLTFRLIYERMAGRDVSDASDDDFTYGCQFGEDVAVLWGAQRKLALSGDITALDATGQAIAAPPMLDPVIPVVLVSQGGAVKDGVILGSQKLEADSFHQFAYPQGDELQARGDSFARFARKAGQIIPLMTLPGQERSGVPWFPYRGHPDHRDIRLTADSMLPGADKDIVHRYMAKSEKALHLRADFTAGGRSVDGIFVTVTLRDEVLFSAAGGAQEKILIDLPDLQFQTGDMLEISVNDNGSPKGDVSKYRISLATD